MKRIDFVFWLKISKRFTNGFNWTTRGANFYEANRFGLRLSIGLPWRKCVIRQMGDRYIKNANHENLKPLFSIKLPFFYRKLS